MKKLLLVLRSELLRRVAMAILILSIAPFCSAPEPDWTISHNTLLDEITVSVIDPLEQDIYLALAVDSNGILGSFAKGINAPSDSSFYDTLKNDGWGQLGQGEIWVMADASKPYTYDDGQWLTADFDFATGKTSAVISLYRMNPPGPGGSAVLLDSLVIPEPATISLLVFGGLLICRRR
jgi:hypothetical protein